MAHATFEEHILPNFQTKMYSPYMLEETADSRAAGTLINPNPVLSPKRQNSYLI